jgi:hypothetical protein
MCASISVYLTSAVPMSGARWGFPSSPVLLFLYATACGLRRTFTPSPNRASRIAFGHVKTLGVRIKLISKLYQHKRRARHPYGLQDALSTLRLSCSPPPGDSATDARLNTGGWLALTRRGLSPRKKHRAFLGAITLSAQRRRGFVRRPLPGRASGYPASHPTDPDVSD